MEELNQALATLITQATTGIDSSVAFLQAELPEVVEQLLMWHAVKSGVTFVLCLIALYLFFWRFPKLIIKKSNEYNDYHGFPFELVFALCALADFAALITINITWLQIWIAPKVWLIEYAASLVK